MSEEQLGCYYRIPQRQCGCLDKSRGRGHTDNWQSQEIFRSVTDRSLKVMGIKL